MVRHLPGLRQTTAAGDDVPDGFFLVRVERLHYQWDRRSPFFSIRLTILEPAAFAGRTISGRLYCTAKALWKFSWFLRAFDYDPELLEREEIDERAIRELTGVVNVSHQFIHGTSMLHFEGFGPASQWTELAPFLPPGKAAA